MKQLLLSMPSSFLSFAKMPFILYGTAWKKEKTAELVIKAVKYGYRGIDTACHPKHYNEKGVGVAIEELVKNGIKRSDLYIQTKFTPLNGQDPLNIPYAKKASLKEQVLQSFEISKENLNVSYLDGLILHGPLETQEKTLIVWQAFEEIYRRGEVKKIGLSNHYDLKELKELYEVASIKPTILQNRFYQATHYDQEIRKWCLDNNIVYQSFWTLSANPYILSSKVIQEIAHLFKKTAAQTFFRYLIQIGIVPLTGTCSDIHMQEDLDIMDFELPINSLKSISCLLNGIQH